jgi:hypothetical protein
VFSVWFWLLTGLLGSCVSYSTICKKLAKF